MRQARIRALVDRLPQPLRRSLGRLRRIIQRRPESTFVRVAYTTPRQIVLITTRHDGADNVWPLDAHIVLSFEPGLFGISVNRNGYGAELVRRSGVFVVNFVPASWEKIIFYCGNVSGRRVDKFAATGLRKEQAQSVDAPRLADSLGALECKVRQVIEFGDHTLFVGEVTHKVLRADEPRLHHIDIRMQEMIAAGQDADRVPAAGSVDR